MTDDRTQVAPGLWRTDLQRHDLGVPGREVIQSRIDVEPDSPPLRHVHPGEEVIYVLEGQLEYQIDGRPTKVYGPGEVLTVPAGVVHAVRNVGRTNGSELATYIVENSRTCARSGRDGRAGSGRRLDRVGAGHPFHWRRPGCRRIISG